MDNPFYDWHYSGEYLKTPIMSADIHSRAIDIIIPQSTYGGRERDRTADTGIFSPVLYQLSYPANKKSFGFWSKAFKNVIKISRPSTSNHRKPNCHESKRVRCVNNDVMDILFHFVIIYLFLLNSFDGLILLVYPINDLPFQSFFRIEEPFCSFIVILLKNLSS